jgi:copper chaperone CopZ
MSTSPTPGGTVIERDDDHDDERFFHTCVAKIEKQVGRLDGVSAVKVHFASARIEVDHDPALASVEDLVAAVAKAGYVARPATF